MKIHGQERNRSFLFLQTKEEKKATRTKGTFKPLEILMASEKQYRSIEVSVCMFSLAQYTHYTHIPLEEMNMHKIASFQVSSCFFSPALRLFCHFGIVDFTVFSLCSFCFEIVCLSPSFSHFRYSFSFAYATGLNAPHNMLMHVNQLK